MQLGPQWDCIEQLLGAMPKQLLAQAASQVGPLEALWPVAAA